MSAIDQAATTLRTGAGTGQPSPESTPSRVLLPTVHVPAEIAVLELDAGALRPLSDEAQRVRDPDDGTRIPVLGTTCVGALLSARRAVRLRSAVV